jgi:hypothetical protein
MAQSGSARANGVFSFLSHSGIHLNLIVTLNIQAVSLSETLKITLSYTM